MVASRDRNGGNRPRENRFCPGLKQSAISSDSQVRNQAGRPADAGRGPLRDAEPAMSLELFGLALLALFGGAAVLRTIASQSAVNRALLDQYAELQTQAEQRLRRKLLKMQLESAEQAGRQDHG